MRVIILVCTCLVLEFTHPMTMAQGWVTYFVGLFGVYAMIHDYIEAIKP